MAKIMVGVLLLVLVAGAVIVVAGLLTSRPRRVKPPAHASNATWERYYRDLAEHARRTGNEASAADYDSLARTYSTLPDQP